MRVLIFLISFFLLGSAFSQQRQIDSLMQLASKATQDTLKLKIYHDICVICETKDNLKYGRLYDSLASSLLNKAGNEKEREKFLREKIEAYNVIGIYYDELGQIDSLERYRIKSVELAKLTRNREFINQQVDNLAEMYRRENLYTKAMNIYTDELQVSEKENKKEQILHALIGITVTYSRMHNNKKALEYAFKRLKLVQEQKWDSTEVGYAYFAVGQQYYNLHDYKNTIVYYLKTYQLLEGKIKDRDMSHYLYSLAVAYNENRNSVEARKFFFKALDLATKMKSPHIMGVINSEIGQTYFYENNMDKAIEYKVKGIELISHRLDGDAFKPNFTISQAYLKIKKYDLAEKHVLVAKKIAEDRWDIHNQKAVMKVLADIYSSKGDQAKSNTYLIKFYQLGDSLDKMKNTEELLYKELNYQNEKNEMKLLAEQMVKDQKSEEEKSKQRLIIFCVSIGLLLVAIFAGLVYNRFKITQKQKLIIEQKEIETSQQKHLLLEKNKEITDSINYAQRLQQAILPPTEFITKKFPENFVIYKPKDIVAGDFYWAEQSGSLVFIAAADSTGHGVPGAMVSVVCSNALNRTVKEFGITAPGKILDKTRELVIETFEKGNMEIKDGMDISLLCVDSQNKKLFWSGANNPLWYIEGDVLTEMTADKQPVGKSYDTKPFTTKEIEYKAGITFYLFTDGFADQFGGPKGKKFKYKKFEETLVSLNKKPMNEQAQVIETIFNDWKGDLEQVDDVCIIGIKI